MLSDTSVALFETDAELASVVPLKRRCETVYVCVKHHGVMDEYNRQFNGAVKNKESAATVA